MANKYKLLEADTFDNNKTEIMKSNGEEFPKDIARKLFDLVFGIMANTDVELSTSLGDFVTKK